jgi:light-regulated signal transduction histidine kinase (bacteriophytochrome)
LEQFAFAISHDLQEPLRMVMGFLGLLELKYSSSLDETAQKYIQFAVDGAKRMKQKILELLEYSRIERTENVMEEIAVMDLINEIILLLSTQIKERNAIITFDNLPAIFAYRAPMMQVLQNLISNALKYQKIGDTPEITISAIETIAQWEFQVKDNGIGINAKFFDKIFVIFQRLHLNEQYSGTGVGLAITKKMIESMGGKIWVESEEGKGSIFYFTIPKNIKNQADESIPNFIGRRQ